MEKTKKKLPLYIKSNVATYQKIADDFYNHTAKAKTAEEYQQELEKVCRKYMRDLSDSDVLSYMQETGIMEEESIVDIKNYYINNAEPFQKAILSANLVEGKRYTLVYLNDLGFPTADKITFAEAEPCQYAQFTDAVKLTFKRTRKRTKGVHYFYDCSLAIYEGWHDLEESDVLKKTGETKHTTKYETKYTCFDSRFFTELIQRLGEPIVEYKNLKTGKNGKIFA